MHPGSNLEPNARRESTLRPRFFDELTAYVENLGTHGRTPGLLPTEPKHVLPYLDPPDVLQLPRILAIGERGHLIAAGDDDPECALRPLETRDLPVGKHRAYACLAREKISCGPLVIEPANNGNHQPGRTRAFRAPWVTLQVGDARFEHRDWLQVAEISRERDRGSVSTYLNGGFHPAIQDMRAYCRRNPLKIVAERAFLKLGRKGTDAWQVLLGIELRLLLNIAETASPYQAFVQAQRVIGMLRAGAERPLLLDGELMTFRFTPENFMEFLSRLDACLDGEREREIYPTTIGVDSNNYQRISGEFVADGEDGEFWKWLAPGPGFNANALAVYLPWAEMDRIPLVRYGRQKGESNDVATCLKPTNIPGVVILLENARNVIETVYLTTEAKTKLHELRLELGEGHAVYHR